MGAFRIEKSLHPSAAFFRAYDRGIDIAGFADAEKLQGVWDNYQCKRYLGHAIYPSEAWPEIGKILWHSFNKEYRAPRRYYFVAPHGVGTTLAGLLPNPAKLKKGTDSKLGQECSERDNSDARGRSRRRISPVRAGIRFFDIRLEDSPAGHQRSSAMPVSPLAFRRRSSGSARCSKAAGANHSGRESVRRASQLIKKISRVAPKSNVKTLITPVSGEGMVLNLRPDEIAIGRG